MNLVRACPLQKPIQHCSLESFVMWEGPEDALGTSPKLFGSHCLLHPACQVTDKQSPVLASTVICKQDQDQIERELNSHCAKQRQANCLLWREEPPPRVPHRSLSSASTLERVKGCLQQLASPRQGGR